jgi:hypothetical protein
MSCLTGEIAAAAKLDALLEECEDRARHRDMVIREVFARDFGKVTMRGVTRTPSASAIRRE